MSTTDFDTDTDIEARVRADDRGHVFHSWSAQALIDPLPRDPIPTLGTGPSGPKSIDASVHPERLVPRPTIPSVRAIIGTRRRGLDSTELVPCD